MERNSYHSIARMKYENTKSIEFVDMGYQKEEEEATNTFEMHFIELPKFKEKNPDCNTKLEQWLWLIDGSKEEKVEMSAKENEEINKTVKELNKLSKDPDEVAKYEEREWSIMRYDVEMKTNRELGEKRGEKRGREEGRKAEKIKIAKKLYSLQTPIEKIAEIVDSTLDIKMAQEIEDKLYKEIKDDMLEKDIFLDKFSTDEFMLEFESTKFDEDTYFVNMTYDVKMPMQYSDSAIEKVYTEGIVAEDKLQIEYILLSTIAIRDIINGNFKDSYIAEFTTSLFKKKQKSEGILSLLGNEALQDKISLNISYEDYIKNQKSVLEYTKKGYNFTITLDDTIKNIEDVEKLKMFKLVIAPENMHLYKEIKSNKTILKNVVCE